MFDRRYGAFRNLGTVPAGGNPPSPIQSALPARGLSWPLAESAYRYRRPTERIAEMRRVELNPRIQRGLETKRWSALSAARALSPARKSGPVRFVETLLGTWRLKPDSAIPLLGFESSEVADVAYVGAILDGRQPLVGRDIKYRIACLIVIRSTLSGLFRDEAVENEWLREAHPLLDNRIPMDLMLEGRMENLLLVKEYVDEFAGR